MIDYPNFLENIFEKLNEFDIKAIIVGGYVRDKLLKLDSKDIDIELYNLDSLQQLETILGEFGTLSSVGKSFGVCKLKYKDLDIDFSLPRIDNKIESGHKGFHVTTFKNIDYATAAKRRDFTINAIGFDVTLKKLLDPYNGVSDLHNKILRAVDIKKFDEDPLRVLRAVQFSSRFDFQLDDTLFKKCKNMINKNVLKELPSERIYEEFQKMLLKSKKPSYGFLLLKNLGAFSFFKELQNLNHKGLQSLDYFRSLSLEDEKKALILMLALLCKDLSFKEIDSFLGRLTTESKVLRDVKKILELYNTFDDKKCDNYTLYSLAEKFELKYFFIYLEAASLGEKKESIDECRDRAKDLKILNKPMVAFIQGRDLISIGLKPSKEFSTLLFKIYEAQKRELFNTKKEALIWTKRNLLS